jgi:hypothetical protein
MQKQMFEQFDQFVTMMCQTMGALHQDQMALVRDELTQIRRLTQELSVLKDEQSSLAASRPDSSVAGILGAPTSGALPPIANDGAAAAQPQQRLTNGSSCFEECLPDAGTGGSETARTESLAVENARHSWEAKRAVGAHGEPRSGEPSFKQTSEEIHILLTRRIAAIQQEQRGRLHKLFGLVTRR